MLAAAGRTPQALLYAGLEPKAAAEVAAALDRQGIPFEIRGESIWVPRDRRDSVRLALAGENLPRQNGAGYEILDSLSGFGTTAEMFDAAYWRAKEGELARTLLAAPGLRAARVHIANPPHRPFRTGADPTASVVLDAGPGGVAPAMAEAARHLVAAAVAGLRPDRVAVIDGARGVLVRATGPGSPEAIEGTDRAATLRLRLERLLAARVGEGRAVVEVNVDTVRESETISERVVDPASRVPIAQDSTERSESEEGAGPGGVTIASNLPDPAAVPEAPAAKRSSTETRERTNFEVSEVRRERVKLPGEVRRISVAVLVDGIVSAAPDGSRVWTPRPEEELARLAELVRSAIGFDAARGDVVTVTSLEFSPLPETAAPAAPGLVERLAAEAGILAQIAVLGLVALALGLFVLRPMLAPPPAAVALPLPDEEAPQLAPPAEVAAALEAAGDLLEEGAGELPRLATLRESIAARGAEAAELLRSWLEAPDQGEEPA